MQDNTRDHLGVLVGWHSQDLGERLILALQTYERTTWDDGEEPRLTQVMMTKGQATVLANYLLKEAGATAPPRRRGWFASLFG